MGIILLTQMTVRTPCFDPALLPQRRKQAPREEWSARELIPLRAVFAEEFRAQTLEAGSLGSNPGPALGLRQGTSPLSASACPSVKWMLTCL